MNVAYAWFGRAVMALTLVLAASACTSVVNGALGLAGIGNDKSSMPTRPRNLLASRPESPSVKSGYEVMSNRLVWDPRTGRLALDRGPLLGTQWDACEPVGETNGLLPVRRLMLPTRSVTALGPLEVQVAGLPTIGTRLAGYGFARPDRMMRVGPSRMPLMGTLACGFPTLDIRLTWFGSAGPLVAR